MGQLGDGLQVTRPVRGVHVSGFAVSGFPGSGVLALGDTGSVFDHIVAAGNGNFGITSVFSSGDRYLSNVAFSNDFAGFQIADSPQADAQLSGNAAYDNRFGIFLIGASRGSITGNELHDNCSGLGFFDAGDNGRTSDWMASENVVEHNNRSCPALPEGDPAISGNGIVILGGQHIILQHNEVRSNRPAAGPPTSLTGGIVVMTIPSHARTAPTDDLILQNVVCDNLPANLVYDGTGTGVRFLANGCIVSSSASG
jgi:parallel beta-helix repeat protein